jgi:Cytochrome c oxidase assembly protein PET191
MSAGGAFGGARGFQAKAPEKGVFPLDHFGECAEVDRRLTSVYQAQTSFIISKHVLTETHCVPQAKDAYMRCLADHQNVAERCTYLAKKYLQCRMDKFARSSCTGSWP